MTPRQSLPIAMLYWCISILFLTGCEKNACLPINSSVPSTDSITDTTTDAKEITNLIPVTSGVTDNLWGVDFANSNVGYVCGFNGTILKTTDGGTTWMRQNSTTTDNLFAIAFVDQNTGYCVGNFQTILKTTDGGATWIRQHYNPSTSQSKHLRHLRIFDVNNVYTGGIWGAFFTTNNGGSTWLDKNIDNSTSTYCNYFSDLNNGFVGGNFTRIRRTTNGGVNWSIEDPAAIHTSATSSFSTILSCFFFNNNEGYMVMGNSVNIETHVLKTIDGGLNWAITYTPSFTDAVFYDIDFSSLKNGLIVCKKEDGASGIGKVLKTNDGGATWNILGDEYSALTRVCTLSDSTAIIIGYNGTIIKGE